MSSIFHITARSQWQAAQNAGVYCCESLETEGFIHCSTPAQVVKVANWFYAGQEGLVLLGIDPDRLQSELRYEVIETGEAFPHLYGELNLDAVVQVFDFSANADGGFTLPEAALPFAPDLT